MKENKNLTEFHILLCIKEMITLISWSTISLEFPAVINAFIIKIALKFNSELTTCLQVSLTLGNQILEVSFKGCD